MMTLGVLMLAVLPFSPLLPQVPASPAAPQPKPFDCSAPGQTGQSFNLYDRTSKRWHQTWVDSGGGRHDYWAR